MCCECTKKRRSSCPEESNVTIDNGLSAIPNITHILCSSQAAPVEEKPCHTCHHDKAKNKKHEKENDWVFHHEHHKKEDDWDHEHHEKDDDCECDHDHHKRDDHRNHCGRKHHQCGCKSSLGWDKFWEF